ncbi:MAG TPA: FkbM family methyltransferase [Polyangia bacterium]|nr:FkbM family methyltransferase [Polyangia bacterium]
MAMPMETLDAILAALDGGRELGRDDFARWGVARIAELPDDERRVVARLLAEEARFAGERRVASLAWTLGSERGLDFLIGQAREAIARAASVARAAREGRALTIDERLAFGALGTAHAEVLLAALRANVVSERELSAMTGHGVEGLNERLRQFPASLPLEFETIDAALVDRAGARERLAVESPVVVRHGAVSFTLMISSGVELWRAATLETKEPETLAWLEDTLADGDCLYDVGANIGLYTLFALALRPRATVVSFEPDAINFHRLCRNLLANAFQDRCAPFPIALSDRAAFGQFHSSRFVAGGSEHWASPHMESDRPSELTTGCALYDLDSFVAGASFVRPPTHLKIDVDGIESRVVRGAARTLAGATLRHLCVEGRPAGVEQVRPLLEQSGFRHVRSTRQAVDVGDHHVGRHLFAKG